MPVRLRGPGGETRRLSPQEAQPVNLAETLRDPGRAQEAAPEAVERKLEVIEGGEEKTSAEMAQGYQAEVESQHRMVRERVEAVQREIDIAAQDVNVTENPALAQAFDRVLQSKRAELDRQKRHEKMVADRMQRVAEFMQLDSELGSKSTEELRAESDKLWESRGAEMRGGQDRAAQIDRYVSMREHIQRQVEPTEERLAA